MSSRNELQAGTLVTLTIVREVTPNGFYLSNGDEEVLLHYSQIAGPNRIEVNQRIEVFIYYDTEDRIAATMKRPLLVLGEVGLLEVVDIHPHIGTFLEMGLGRHLLLPFKEQPEQQQLRPQVGDRIYVILANDRVGRLIAKLAGEDELAPLTFHAPTAWKNQWLEARVYNPMEEGTFVICDGGVLGFGAIGMIHASERISILRVGEQLKARVTFVREDGRINLSMRPLKEVGMEEDAEKILAYLQATQEQAMPYSDQTTADIISEKFNISKSAFKRALGKLMKQCLIYQEGNMTYLKQDKDK